MGTRNQERRAAKQRRRADRRRREGTGSAREAPSGARGLGGALDRGLRAAVGGDEPSLDAAVDELAAAGVEGDHLLGTALVEAVRSRYAEGWQPADLAVLTRRRLAPAREILGAVLDEEAAGAGWSAAQLHPRWRAQLTDLGAWPPSPVAAGGPLTARPTRSAHISLVDSALRLLAMLRQLPPMPELLPPPGRPQLSGADDLPTGLDGKVLGKIRALLAKAESTTFPEEAEALSAKAQALMSRHAIDVVVVGLSHGGDEQPIGVRLAVEDPYADAKALLLQAVSRANRCWAMWYQQLGLASTVGFDADLALTELLFTSLLVQANRAMLSATVPPGPDGSRRTTSFRRSFLAAYASRIGDRLAAVTEAAVAEAEAAGGPAGRSLLPALVAREVDVQRTARDLHPGASSRNIRVSHHAGAMAGQVAADLADLAIGAELDGRAGRALG